MSEKYKVTGMSCAACSARVEKAVSSLDGVSSCSVNLLTGDLSVDGSCGSDVVMKAVVDAGYGISKNDGSKPQDTEEMFRDTESPKLIKRFVFSIVFLIALMYFSMGEMMHIPLPPIYKEIPLLNAVTQLLLSTLVLVINQKFFINGVKGIINRAPNMDTLVAVGSSASYLYSVYILFVMCIGTARGDANIGHYLHGIYFEAAAMVPALITLGKFLEAKAKGNTTNALKDLMNLSPKVATLIVDGKEVVVKTSEIKIGDIFAVHPGESIPTDGEVVEGDSSVDESALTGESIPCDKNVGSAVYGATINKQGYMLCRATKVGEDTAIGGVIKLVREASSSKAPIAKLADKVAGVFVPVVMSIALVTLIGWLIYNQEFGHALSRAVSVLVISCPCALGLATPVAIMVGSGVGAKNGLLFKNAESLEECGRINTVVLDKTGTITEGAPRVTGIYPNHDLEEEFLLKIAYSLERMSEHPLGEAVCDYAEEKKLSYFVVSKFEALSGKGISGVIRDKKYFGVSFKEAKNICKIDTETEKLYSSLTQDGKTPLFFIEDGKLIGIIAVADTVKSDAVFAINYLKNLGVKVVMLTGDNEGTARAIAKTVGIEYVEAGVLPDGKDKVIKELRKEGRVAMVGDGINDAPALASANVGIAIGNGTDIAIESANVVLMGKGLSDVPNAIALSRRCLLNIKENLFWAFFYNCIGIPLAAGLFGFELPIMFGAFAMSLSSFFVVSNALRLNFFKTKKYNGEPIEPIIKNGSEIKINENRENEEDEMKEKKVFNVEGMMCPHCEARVKEALEKIEGVAKATPNHKKNEVKVVYDSEVSDEVVVKAITDAGYKVV